MSMRSNRTSRSLTFVSTLLLTTALAAPAFAQIEEIVVTAQKKSEDIQSVPIAVSAFTTQDLAAHQIETFKDLQFSIPSVSFSNGNFGSANFTIRGIGSAATANSGDPGVSVNINQVYLDVPPLTSGVYYDLAEVQVLRGPQSTLWGRNATGGAIDLETAKPALDAFAANLEGTYGNYNDQELRAMVNIPIITDQLGVRLAGFWENRDGTVKNIYPGLNPGSGIDSRLDSRDDYSFRGSVRWEPTSNTLVDAIIQTSHEHDTRLRGQAQLCDRDDSGILGCLPDKLAYQPVNSNATLANELTSSQTFSALNPLLALVSLTDLTGPNASQSDDHDQIVPHSLQSVNTDFNPLTHAKDLFASVHVKQTVTSWLDADLTMGVDNNSYRSQENYYNTPGDTLDTSATCNQLGFLGDPTCTPIAGVNRLSAAQQLFGALFPINYGQYFAGHLGSAPVTQIAGYNSTGVENPANIIGYNSTAYSFDELAQRDNEWSGELRFDSNFQGPVNFKLGYYHNSDTEGTQYIVNSNMLNYEAIVLGGFSGGDGLVLAPSQFDSDSHRYTLDSNALYGELYYDAVPDVLKFTAGLRYSVDKKTFESRNVLLNGAGPIGGADLNTILAANGYDSDPATPGDQLFTNQETTFRSWTGRAVVDYTPTLDFTDATHLYASYSRGYRAGGFNPPPLNAGDFPTTFAPETIDAYEIGAKNTLLNNTLVANFTGWYYNYQGFQVSEIVDRASINQNINSKLWGVEGEFFWAPVDALQFNMNVGYTHSALDSQLDVDPRNPLGTTYANATLVKDTTTSSLCVINNLPGYPTAEAAGLGGLIVAPNTPTVINGHTVASGYSAGGCTAAGAAAIDAITVGGVHPYTEVTGDAINLKGNQMPNTPPLTINFGVQYTFDVGGGYTLIPRADYYWTDKDWAFIFEDGSDRVPSYDVTNAQIQLNAPNSSYYARAWIQNVFDKHNMTGEYLTDASTGLFTNAFVGTPRTFGITVGANF